MTLKLDALFYTAGVIIGLFVFGEIVPWFWEFYISAGYKGRYLLSNWLGVDPGWVVLGIVLVAVACFVIVQRVEACFTARRRAAGVQQ